MIPLILGLIGVFFQFDKDKKNFFVLLALFFLTGAALVLYLNSPPIEPRERDYIYVGSYYVFAMWIGLAVLGIYNAINKRLKNDKISAGIAFAICMAAPVIMAAEGWDDHDRSNRYFSVDSAKNFLASCAPNAVIFTGGDNDTFPLWYAQEVEGFRTDVRVIVLSYFNTDWYIEQMMRRAYESEPLPFNLPIEDYAQAGSNDFLPVSEQVKNPIDLGRYIQLLKSHDRRLKMTQYNYNTVPSRNMYLKVDTASVLQKGIIPDQFRKYLVNRIDWSIKGRGLEKKDLAILDMMAANNWERPLYFNNTS